MSVLSSSALPAGPEPSVRPALPIDPLPLPQPGWGAEQARDAVAEAALVLPVLDRPAALVRALSTVVFRVDDLAVKVHPPGTDPAHLARVHAVLADAPVAVTACAAPVVASHGVVTVMPWAVSTATADWGAVGHALRRLHDLPGASALPDWAPLRRLPAQLEHLPQATAEVVLSLRAAVLDRLAAVERVLPPGAVHGDVSPENVVLGAGAARWIDLDFVCHGMREYDVAAVVRRYESGALSAGEYAAFSQAYGLDLRGWPGLGLLEDLCRLSGLGFRLWLDRCAGRDSDWLPGELGRLSGAPAGC